MTKRWKDRIQILARTAGTYDVWGHSGAETWVEMEEVWADVRLQFSARPTAIVTVRAPFDYTADSIRIRWLDQLWKPTLNPLFFPDTQLVQFKIEQL